MTEEVAILSTCKSCRSIVVRKSVSPIAERCVAWGLAALSMT